MTLIPIHQQRNVFFAAAILFLLLPLTAFTQPQNWLHFFQKGELFDPMLSIVVDNDDVIWATTSRNTKLLYKIDVNEGFDCQTNLTPFSSIDKSYSLFIASNNDDCIYLFTPDSIYKIDKANPALITPVLAFPDSQGIMSVYEAGQTGIYVTRLDGSVCLFKDNTLKLIGTPLEGTIVAVKMLDSQNRLWFISTIKGLIYYKNNTWMYLNKENSGLFNDTSSISGSKIFETPDKKIIFGSLKGSLQVFDGTTWKQFSPLPSGEYQKQIRCCARDSTGAIWVGSVGGTLRFFNNQWYYFTESDATTFHAPFNIAMDITVDKKNRVWFAMGHDGVFMLDQSTTPSQCATAKKLRFTKPAQNQAIIAGTRDTIAWDSYGNIDSVALTYKTNTNGEWIEVTSRPNIYQQSSPTWLVPATLSNNYFMRIRDYKDSTVQDIVGPFSVVAAGTNLPPIFQSLPDTVMVKKNQQTTLTIRAADPDKDPLTFTYSTLPSWVTARDSILTFDPVSASTTFTFTVTVSDGKGATASDSARVVVEPSTGSAVPQPALNRTTTPLSITIAPSFLSLTPVPGISIRNAALYSLAGKKTGEFSKTMGRFTLTRKPGVSTATVSILRVSLLDATGTATTISRLLLWQ